MLIQNKQARLITFPNELGRLIPGVNAISAEVWKKVEGSHYIKHALAEGDIVVRVQEDAGFAKMATGKAVALVRETFDTSLLRQWNADERHEVRTAVAEQLEKVKLPQKPAEA